MTNCAAFIDLPNVYSGLLRSNLAEPNILRDYFLHWLDLDLLVSKLTSPPSSIWVFYSGDRIGPSKARVMDKDLRKYIERINSLVGVTARNVNIPGEQREPLSMQCEHCGRETTVQSKSEKGIDAALSVHLFDTMDAWDTAYLLSGDADFVPVVESLRRRGKIVIGAGFPKPAPALVRECYSYIDLRDAFVKDDIAVYKLLNTEGIVARWIRTIEPEAAMEPEQVKITLSWPASYGLDNSNIDLGIYGSCKIDNLHMELQNMLESSQFKYQEYHPKDGRHFYFPTSFTHLQVVERKLQKLTDSIQGLRAVKWSGQMKEWRVEYQYSSTERKYNLIT